TLTGTSSYSFTMTPLDNPSAAYTATGTLSNTSPINWIEFQFYNTDSDFYPTMIPPNPVAGGFNRNGGVGAAGYLLWRKGGSLANEVGDPGTSSPADYTEWRARFGNVGTPVAQPTDYYIRSIEITSAGSGSSIQNGSIPEPSGMVLFAATAMGVVSIRVP